MLYRNISIGGLHRGHPPLSYTFSVNNSDDNNNNYNTALADKYTVLDVLIIANFLPMSNANDS